MQAVLSPGRICTVSGGDTTPAAQQSFGGMPEMRGTQAAATQELGVPSATPWRAPVPADSPAAGCPTWVADHHEAPVQRLVDRNKDVVLLKQVHILRGVGTGERVNSVQAVCELVHARWQARVV